jgi:transcriptional regulator with XRE-family HTH domain
MLTHTKADRKIADGSAKPGFGRPTIATDAHTGAVTDHQTREIGTFLRSRRERLTPRELGLEPGPRRKVDGLRREEVAALAGLSTDYYQRLEQGRKVRPSDAMLESIADALDLSEIERRHLKRLGHAARNPRPTADRTADPLPRHTKLLLSALGLPAFVVNRYLDVLAWNNLAAALIGDPDLVAAEQRNVLMSLFPGENLEHRTDGCDATALDYIGILRTTLSHDPEDARAIAIVDELNTRSPEFRRLWERYEVSESVEGAKIISHPRVGDIAMQWDAYHLPGPASSLMIVFTPQPGHEERLNLLKVIADTKEDSPRETQDASALRRMDTKREAVRNGLT